MKCQWPCEAFTHKIQLKMCSWYVRHFKRQKNYQYLYAFVLNLQVTAVMLHYFCTRSRPLRVDVKFVDLYLVRLTHWGRVTHICGVELGHRWFRQWLVASSAASHYLNQWWNIVNSNLRNKLQWNPTLNSFIFIQKNAFENAVCEMASILSRPQCVNNNKDA